MGEEQIWSNLEVNRNGVHNNQKRIMFSKKEYLN